jgi:hypothetical protein
MHFNGRQRGSDLLRDYENRAARRLGKPGVMVHSATLSVPVAIAHHFQL